MIATKENFYWESRNGVMFLCFNNRVCYRDILIASIKPIAIKAYIRILIHSIKKYSKVLYIPFSLINSIIERDLEWLQTSFRGNSIDGSKDGY